MDVRELVAWQREARVQTRRKKIDMAEAFRLANCDSSDYRRVMASFQQADDLDRGVTTKAEIQRAEWEDLKQRDPTKRKKVRKHGPAK